MCVIHNNSIGDEFELFECFSVLCNFLLTESTGNTRGKKRTMRTESQSTYTK